MHHGAHDPPFEAVVIGAGISGLVTALRLQRAGLRVALLEAAARCGGVIATQTHDGFLFEHGPNSALDTSPLIGALVDDLHLGAELRWASAVSNRRYVVRGGLLTALPMSPLAFVGTPLFSASAKLALLREVFVPRTTPGHEESIAAFVRRRLGSEFLDYAIDPFVAGVYAGDPEQISVAVAFPKLHALEQRWGSLVRGQIFGAAERRRQRETSKNSARSFSFSGGMQMLTDALAAAVGDVFTDACVTRIAHDAAGLFTVQTLRDGRPVDWRSRAVVLAVPADAAASLVREHAADAAAALNEIAYAPVATVASGYAAAVIAHPLDGFGCLVPRREGRRVLGVLFSSSMFDGRAGPGQVLLTTFIGGQRQPELPALDKEELGAIAHAEHAALLGAWQAPLFQQVTRWPRAIPQYTLGHLERVARADAAQRVLPGLFFSANWKGGVAVGDCISNAHVVAGAVVSHLRRLE
jgi:oxygen-dependent protoporphyrinogen oxidase